MIVKRMVMQIGDDGEEIEAEEEYDDGLPDPSLIEDRGDDLDDDLEVDADIVAALAGEDKSDRVIPKSRFDEVNNEKNDLKAQNAALLAQIAAGTVAAPVVVPPVAAAAAAAVTFDLDAKEAEYAEALTDGELDKAATLRKEIRTYERESLKAELRNEALLVESVKTVESRKAAVVAQAFADHPELDNNSDLYDPALVGKINRMQLAYAAEGKPADEALSLAIADFVKPAAAAAPVSKVDVPARARAAAAAAAQPPGLGGTGTGARAARDVATDINSMTDAEFDALPEREKKRLRGD